MDLLESTGSTGDCYDNALAESINGLDKAELIHRNSWKNHAEVERATLGQVDWYNNHGWLERIGHIPPVAAEKPLVAAEKPIMLPEKVTIWQPKFPDLSLSKKIGAVQAELQRCGSLIPKH